MFYEGDVGPREALRLSFSSSKVQESVYNTNEEIRNCLLVDRIFIISRIRSFQYLQAELHWRRSSVSTFRILGILSHTIETFLFFIDSSHN